METVSANFAKLTSSARVGEAKGIFNAIRLPHPGQREFNTAFEELRLACRAAPNEAMGGVQILAPVGSGKTVGAELYAQKINGRATEAGSTPVLVATLESSGTQKSVPSSILRALNAPRPDRGEEATLWFRVRQDLKRRNVELLILDEADRLTRRPSIAAHIASALRDLSDQKIVPLAFVCTQASEHLFRNSKALNERLDPPVILHPLDWLIDEDRAFISDLCRGFDEAIVTAGILPEISGLDAPYIAEMIAEASSGILRQLKFIIGTAMTKVVRDNGDRIEINDLAIAVDEYAIAKGFLEENPFNRAV